MLKIIGYNLNHGKVETYKSDEPFKIEV